MKKRIMETLKTLGRTAILCGGGIGAIFLVLFLTIWRDGVTIMEMDPISIGLFIGFAFCGGAMITSRIYYILFGESLLEQVLIYKG